MRRPLAAAALIVVLVFGPSAARDDDPAYAPDGVTPRPIVNHWNRMKSDPEKFVMWFRDANGKVVWFYAYMHEIEIPARKEMRFTPADGPQGSPWPKFSPTAGPPASPKERP